ncbi:Receptor-type tyrosine-protein phosphatase F [Stylophora pistillata]|uniref:Receptor-type tyrosine-protein phosphatase F n=1 Tax=Stylophora pistillata TaxID=50429 RepID=A0A2B4S0D2_STYPI|nr:Receptor-type tyrosine-protein phosphatase F [Stylophora pistillata]
MKSRSNTYGSQTLKPEGQVTLVCERKGKFHTIDFLVVNVLDDKTPILSGRDAQALKYLTIYADETNAVKEETRRNTQKLPALGKLTSEDILKHYPNVFKPRRGKPLGSPMHIDFDPSVTPIHAPARRVPVEKLNRVNEELKRLCKEGIIRPMTSVFMAVATLRKKPTFIMTKILCIYLRSAMNTIVHSPRKKFNLSPALSHLWGTDLPKNGVQRDPSKVAAITGMPTPADKAALQRFLGMCQYLSKFCPNLSQTVLPLRDLTRDDTEFLWSEVHEAAFNSAKTLIASTTVLPYYDVSLPVTPQVDASDSAIGGVLLQEGHPVYFTSHTLSATEKNYAHIEKECLAIVSCMEKWHHYLYGKRDITVHSDHQPLETIFKKPLSRALRSLQRMMLRLQNYEFTVQYKKGKELFVADTLSRASLNGGTQSPSRMTQDCDVFRVNLTQMDLSPNLVKPGTMNQIRKETEKDPSLMTVNNMVLGGWPRQKSEVLEEIRAYWDLRDEISEPMQSHAIPSRPWERVSADLFQLNGSTYLVLVDHYSDYIVLEPLKNTSAVAVIRALKRNFARHGIPDECVTDNGPQFVSHEYARFAREYGFTSIRSSPYLSRGNGKAESAVKIAKNILKKSRFEDPYLALLAYRNTSQQGYQYSPAQRLMSRKLRDIIPTAASQLFPQAALGQVTMRNIKERRARSKAHYDKRASGPLKPFAPREKVFLEPRPTNKSQPWIYGEVIEQPTSRSCVVKTAMGPIRRSHAQIREARTEPAERHTTGMDQLEIASTHSEQEQERQPADLEQMELESRLPRGEGGLRRPHMESESAPSSADECGLRRSQRTRKRPSRFKTMSFPIQPPTAFNLTANSSTSIAASWQLPPIFTRHGRHITGFKLFYRKKNLAGCFSFLNITSGSTLSRLVTGLEKYTEYIFQVLAYTSKGDGLKSSVEVERTMEDAPSRPPSNFYVTATSSTTVTASWQLPPVDSRNGIIKGFKVFYKRKDSSGSGIILTINSESTFKKNVTGLNKYTEYEFQVLAFTSVGDGPYTSVVFQRTNEDVPSQPPSNFTLTASTSTSITAFWQLPPEDSRNGNITGYKLFYKKGGSSGPASMQPINNQATRIQEVSGLDKFTEYEFQILAFTSVGDGPTSTAIFEKTKEAAPSGPPSQFYVIVNSSTSIAASWHLPPEDSRHGIIRGYKLFYKKKDSGLTTSLTIDNGKKSKSVTNLDEYTEYEFQVLAFTSAGDGPRSSTVFTTTMEDAPSAPTSLSFVDVPPSNLHGPRITLSWSKPTEPNGVIRRYTLFYSHDGGVPKEESGLDKNTLSHTVDVLGGVTYQFHVRAVTIRPGPNGTITVTTSEYKPSRGPQEVSSSAVNSSNINITWLGIPREAAYGNIIRYEARLSVLENCTGIQSAYHATINTSTTYVLVTGLSWCAKYEVSVRGYTAAGPGPYSRPVIVQTLAVVWSKETLSSPYISANLRGGGISAKVTLPRFRGNARFYQVIVITLSSNYTGAVKPPGRFTTQDMMTYEEAHKSSVPAAYVAFQFEGNSFDKNQEFVIGDGAQSNGKERSKRSSGDQYYYNKPLQLNTNYRVFLRAFVSETVYVSSNFVAIDIKGKPLIKGLPKTTITATGELAVLTCEVIGETEASVTWTKDGLTSIPHAQLENNGTILIIKDVVPDVSGVYECKAMNKFGESRTATTVIVAGSDDGGGILPLSDDVIRRLGSLLFGPIEEVPTTLFLEIDGAVRPIGVGEVLRRIIGKCVTRVIKTDVIDASGSLQVCAGLKSGNEATIHAMRTIFEADDTDAVLLIDAFNAFNALNRSASLHNIRVLCPPMAIYAINTYRQPVQLFVIGGQKLESVEGTTQGNPLAMSLYAISLQPLITQLEVSSATKQCWFADDAARSGSLLEVIKCWNVLSESGPRLGHFSNAKSAVRPIGVGEILRKIIGKCVTRVIKSDVIEANGSLQVCAGLKSGNETKPEKESAAKAVFADTEINVTSEEQKHLGAVLGSRAFLEEYVGDKVEDWVNEVTKLAEFAVSQPQACYAVFTVGLRHRWTYFLRTLPDISDLLEPLENATANLLIPAIADHQINEEERNLLALSVRLGGLGIANPVELASQEYEVSATVTGLGVSYIKITSLQMKQISMLQSPRQ